MDSDNKYIHEAYMAMAERNFKRLWILCIILAVALVGSNLYWVIREQQFEVVTQEVTQDSEDDGINNFYGGDYYGEADN